MPAASGTRGYAGPHPASAWAPSCHWSETPYRVQACLAVSDHPQQPVAPASAPIGAPSLHPLLPPASQPPARRQVLQIHPMGSSKMPLRSVAARLSSACSGGGSAAAAAGAAAGGPSITAALQPAWRQQLSSSAGAMLLAADALAVTAVAGASAARLYWSAAAAAVASGPRAARLQQHCGMPAAASVGQRWSSSSSASDSVPPGQTHHHPALPPPSHQQGQQQGQAPQQQGQQPGPMFGQPHFGCQAPAVPASQQALFDRQLLIDTLTTVGGAGEGWGRSVGLGWADPLHPNPAAEPAILPAAWLSLLRAYCQSEGFAHVLSVSITHPLFSFLTTLPCRRGSWRR